MFIAETRTFGFQNVLAHAEKQCWALPQTGQLIRKLRTQGFGLQICEPISYRKHLRLRGKKIEIYSKSAKSTTLFGSFLQFPKKYVFTIQCIDRFGWMYFNSATPSHQVPLLWNDYFPKVLLFLQHNELA